MARLRFPRFASLTGGYAKAPATRASKCTLTVPVVPDAPRPPGRLVLGRPVRGRRPSLAALARSCPRLNPPRTSGSRIRPLRGLQRCEGKMPSPRMGKMPMPHEAPAARAQTLFAYFVADSNARYAGFEDARERRPRYLPAGRQAHGQDARATGKRGTPAPAARLTRPTSRRCYWRSPPSSELNRPSRLLSW
jgi:hypothetical protein